MIELTTFLAFVPSSARDYALFAIDERAERNSLGVLRRFGC